MNSAPAETAETGNGREPRVILFGRFMLPDASEHPCQVTQLTPEGAVFLTGIAASSGLGIVAYIDEIGRLEALAGEAVEGGFAVTFQISGPRRERIESRIRLLRGLSPGDDEDDEIRHRRHPRQTNTSASHITLPDGRVYPCEVMDVSVSGAAVKTEVIPALGTSVLLGKMRGRVVRYLDSGVAIEFTRHIEAHTAPGPR